MIESDEVLAVVGAGQAGAELAVQAREGGWPGRIVLAGEEPDLPYHRPPLSKAYLAGAAAPETLALKARATYEQAGIDLVLGRRVVAVDRQAGRIVFDGGPSISYSRLAFATGGRPRLLPSASSGADRAANFHYLRTLADVDRIRARFIDGARLVIIGGGYVGLEVAAVAVKLGLQVVVLEAAERVLSRVTAPAVSSFYERVHREAGSTCAPASRWRLSSSTATAAASAPCCAWTASACPATWWSPASGSCPTRSWPPPAA
jgi:3-phenylpropionate/trans-cinnamate dioxygenase ferredoxin reductase subunit